MCDPWVFKAEVSSTVTCKPMEAMEFLTANGWGDWGVEEGDERIPMSTRADAVVMVSKAVDSEIVCSIPDLVVLASSTVRSEIVGSGSAKSVSREQRKPVIVEESLWLTDEEGVWDYN